MPPGKLDQHLKCKWPITFTHYNLDQPSFFKPGQARPDLLNAKPRETYFRSA